MHAPIVTQMPSVHNDLERTFIKKSSSERILRTRRATDLSKTESSGSSSDTPNIEECDSCGGSGSLVTCDGCYGTYHSECFNPAAQETEPYCSDCTASINAKGTSSPSSGMEVVEMEPKTPVSSPKVKPKEKDTVVSSPKRRRGKQSVKLCEVCDQFGELIACVVCSKSYHTYCVDLVHPTTHYKCTDHENVELIPREVFPLHFTPEKWRPTSLEDDKDTILESPKKSRLNAEEEDVPDLLLNLRNASPDSEDLPPSILKNFTPKFIEFLAWQQLNQIHKTRQRKESDAKDHS